MRGALGKQRDGLAQDLFAELAYELAKRASSHFALLGGAGECAEKQVEHDREHVARRARRVVDERLPRVRGGLANAEVGVLAQYIDSGKQTRAAVGAER